MPVRITGGQGDTEPLEQFADAVQDMEEPLGYVGDLLRAGVASQFETEGSWGGQPWAQLTDVYRNWKEVHGPGLPILVGLRAIGPKGTRRHPVMGKRYSPSGKMRVELLTPTAITVGPKRLVYEPVSDIAGFHQEGTDKMVARPPVVIPLRELAEWDDAFTGWLDGLIERVDV